MITLLTLHEISQARKTNNLLMMTVLSHLTSQRLTCERTPEESEAKEAGNIYVELTARQGEHWPLSLPAQGIFHSGLLFPLSVTSPPCRVYIIVPLFQMWKSRLREIKYLAQGHPGGR